MSRFPKNPFWDQNQDAPIEIFRHDWELAEAEGHVTFEHVLQRLQGMVRHALGPLARDVVAYDEDGFIRALVAETLRMPNQVQIRINPDDHYPPHAHIVIPGAPEMKLTINLDTFEIDQPLPDGWSKKGKAIEQFTRKNQEQLLAWWVKNGNNG